MAIPALATNTSSLPKSLTTSSIVVCTFATLETDGACFEQLKIHFEAKKEKHRRPTHNDSPSAWYAFAFMLCFLANSAPLTIAASLLNQSLQFRVLGHEFLPRSQTSSHLLYHNAKSAPASAMASATANPIPSEAPVMATTLPLILNCSKTLDGVLGTGRGCLGVAQSSMVIDIFALNSLGCVGTKKKGYQSKQFYQQEELLDVGEKDWAKSKEENSRETKAPITFQVDLLLHTTSLGNLV